MSSKITLVVLALPTLMAFPTLTSTTIMEFTYSTPSFSFLNI
jgi:hypothetical protein